MKTKIAPAMQVLSVDVKTNLEQLIQNVGSLPQDIFKDAINSGYHPCGPQYWIYTWESIDPKADFILKICIPVALLGASTSAPKYKLEKLDAFSYLHKMHYGNWENLKDTYGEIMGEIEKEKLTPGNVCREVYLHCDFEQPENNITEVQFGVIKA